MKKYFLIVLLLSSTSCDDPEVMAVPDYMTELYSTNEACPDYDYVTINFPDSTVHFVDSLDGIEVFEVRKYFGSTGSKSYSVSWEDTVRQMRLSITFFVSSEIKPMTKTIFPGKYQFIKDRYNYQNGFELELMTLINNTETNFHSTNNSDFFEVIGTSGNDSQLGFCGSFNLLMSTNLQVNLNIPVTGEYNLTMYDNFR